MILTNGAISLVPSDDREYLADLMRRDKYCCMNDRGIARYAKLVRYLWVGWVLGMDIGGVLYFCFIPGIGWTFDAYSEREKLKKLDNKGAWAYKASVLVLDWFGRNIGEPLYAFVDEENRGAIFMAKKLGFKKQETRNGMVILRKEF
jgi:hypothetical protein